jgi:hypothetical protein
MTTRAPAQRWRMGKLAMTTSAPLQSVSSVSARAGKATTNPSAR